MNKKFVIILSSLIALLIIGGGAIAAVYFIYPTGDSDVNLNESMAENKNVGSVNTPVNTNDSGNTNVANTNQSVIETNKNANVEIPLSEANARSLTKSFIERFGSFSTQSNYENLSNLKIFMTTKMQQWADGFIEENQDESLNEYYGIVTSVVSIKTLSFDNNQAKFSVATQRRETKTQASEPNIFFQDIEVFLKAESGSWKVDAAEWQ